MSTWNLPFFLSVHVCVYVKKNPVIITTSEYSLIYNIILETLPELDGMKTFYIKKGPIYLVSLYLIQTCSMAITKYFQIKTIFRNLFINRLLIGWIIYLLWLLSLTELLLKRLFHQDLDPVKKWILWLWYFLSIGNRLNNAPSYGNAIDRWNLKYAVCVEISVSANGSGI